jgi:rubrerythrin
MEQLTVEEIIKYAIRVEQESYQFYRKASRMLAGNELKSLVDELSEHEVCHISELKGYIKDDTEVDENLSRLLTVDTALFDRIIVSADIPTRATPAEILRIALERESISRQNYEMLHGLAKLTDDIRSTFRSIMEREDEHVKMLRERIGRGGAPEGGKPWKADKKP